MATVWWSANGQNLAQVEQIQITAVAVGGTLSATINSKSVVYTCVTGDTVASAATAWRALLASSQNTPAEFQEETWANPSDGFVTATARDPGTPFDLTTSSAGGAALVQTQLTPSLSASDVDDPNNWLRAGVAGLPQNGDDMILADSNTPLLWNLDALNAVQLNSFQRYQSFEAQIGLPTQNPNGYPEYRPTYFQFTGPPAGTLSMKLGVGATGNGPSLERYNVGGQRTAVEVLAGGSASDTYAVRFLGTNANNTFSITGTSVAIAMQPGEASTVASMTVDGGGSIAMGSGVTFSGTLTLYAAAATLFCVPPTIVARGGSSIFMGARTGTVTSLTTVDGTVTAWNSDTTITSLVMRSGAVLDKSGTLLASTITNSTIDVSTCAVIDPNNTITWTNTTICQNACTSGPFQFGDGRNVRIT